ncbi:MAG: 30S ribosomal protein S16 [Chlamydiae bacterium]|nr:30S ribosomal protein S16 [Chlamydiota bacterium]NGX47658.1 30S ribosomal protein S16 [Chlamydiota bacterium]
MAVKIRLRQQGRANRQTYRLVACDTHVKRDGKYLDNLGWYDPFMAENNAKINEEKTVHWLNMGAEMTHDAKKLIARVAPNVLKHWNEKREAKKVKLAAKRRNSRKKPAAPAK